MAQLVKEHRRIELAGSHRVALVGVRMRPANRTIFQRLSFVVMVALVLSTTLVFGPTAISAQLSQITGSWRGGGSVTHLSGGRERVRCRVKFKRWSKTTVRMKAVCATTAARVVQTALLRRVGSNRFIGTFHNDEYGVTGRIRITVRGRRLSAYFSSETGSASLNLRR